MGFTVDMTVYQRKHCMYAGSENNTICMLNDIIHFERCSA